MVKCRTSLILAAVILYASVSADALFVKYGTPQELPTTIAGLAGTQFVFVERDELLNAYIYTYPNDPRFQLMFDSSGNIAGIRACYVKSDIPITAESNGLVFPLQFFQQSGFVSGNYWNTDVYCLTVLFTDPETLKSGGLSDATGLSLEYVYMNTTGTYTKIGTGECGAEELGFRKQGCFTGMGMHYFSNMNTTTDCNELQPYFLLFEKGVLVALGFVTFGYVTTTNDQVWFQGLNVDIIQKYIAPYGPACMRQYINDYSGCSLHIYFKDQPNLISCDSSSQNESLCS